MSRTSKGDMEALAAKIGAPPVTVTSENRSLVQNWIVAAGVPSAEVKSMRLNTLQLCYNVPAYLRKVLAIHAGKSDAQGEAPQGDVQDVPADAPQGEAPEKAADVQDAPAKAEKDKGKATDAAGRDIGAAIAAAIGAALANHKPGLDETRVREIVEEAQGNARPIVVAIGDILTETKAKPRHAKFPLVLNMSAACLALTRAGANPAMWPFLVGPAGSGKTSCAHDVAEALGLKFWHTGAVDSPYKLLGFLDAQGRLARTSFREAFEHGGLFLFDEIDASDPAALLGVNDALANGFASFPDGIVKRHRDFSLIAGANTIGNGLSRQYVGRNQLDGSSLDRFAFIEWNYDESFERALAGNDEWTDYVLRARKAADSLSLRVVISPRASIAGAHMLAAGLPRADVESAVLWSRLTSEQATKIRAAMVL